MLRPSAENQPPSSFPSPLSLTTLPFPRSKHLSSRICSGKCTCLPQGGCLSLQGEAAVQLYLLLPTCQPATHVVVRSPWLQPHLMAFPLFDLPPEAVELVLGAVGEPEDKRALRLVCKRSRGIVDRGVVAVTGWRGSKGDPPAQLPTLTAWNTLLRLELTFCGLDAPAAAALAAAALPGTGAQPTL